MMGWFWNLWNRRVTSCSVHGRLLEERDIRIKYGRITGLKVSPGYRRARKSLFPFCDDVFLGGCKLGTKKTKLRMNCPECCKTRDEWLRQHFASWASSHELDGV